MSDKKELPTIGGPSGERCGDCYYWEPNCTNTNPPATDGGYGYCRHNPPRPRDNDGLSNMLFLLIRHRFIPSQELEDEIFNCDIAPCVNDSPDMNEDEWCGQWKAKPGVKSE